MYLVWWVHFAEPTTIDDIAEQLRSSPGLYRLHGTASMSELPAADGRPDPGVVVEVSTADGQTSVAVRPLDDDGIGPPAGVASWFKVPESEVVLAEEWLFEVEAAGPDEAFMFGTLGYLLGWDRFDGGWLTAEAKGYSFFSKTRGWMGEPALGGGIDSQPQDGRLSV